MATRLTKQQKEALTEKVTGLIRNGPALRMTHDSSVNEMNINQISGELNRIHYWAIGKDLPAVFSFEPKQLGSGTPSPDNVRPIVGYEIDGIGTVYGGELNIDTGVLTATDAIVDLGALYWIRISASGIYLFQCAISGMRISGNANEVVCSKYAAVLKIGAALSDKECCRAVGSTIFYVRDDSYTDAASFRSAMSGVMLVYELETPKTYTLTPRQMLQLLDQL